MCEADNIDDAPYLKMLRQYNVHGYNVYIQ